ncbi:MAG: T9SS type A sorting domain-containing protein [Lewinella sp.]
MNSFLFRTLLYAALFLPAVVAAQDGDCHCLITRDGLDVDRSPGCYLPAEEMCGITLGDFLFWRVDLSDFEDFRDDTITVGKLTFPKFSGSTLTNSATRFRLDADFNISITLDGENLIDVVIGLVEDRIEAYNDLLAQCKGVCTLAQPNISSVAPITLLSWTTEQKPDHIALNWETADETDNDYFLISHSTNGVDFSELATISGKGTTEFTSTYRYRDYHAEPGTNYYRIQQFDYDGTNATLGIQAAEWRAGQVTDAVVLRPNPVASGQRVSLGAELQEPAEAVIFNADGRLVGRLPLESSSFRVPTLTPGVYTVRINELVNRLVVAR